MNRKPTSPSQTREDRLKAALKANLGRRKAQTRARAAGDADENAGDETPAKQKE